jgi:hypothetical protein
MSARRGSDSRLQRGSVFADRLRFAPHSRFPHHGWLTPAAPGARAQVVANGQWCFATAFRLPRGAYAPLLCCDANVFRRKNDFCDAHTHIRPRAAGVSPPWFGFALATATVYFRLSALARHDRFPHHSCAAMRTSFGEKRFLQCTNAHPTKSGEGQPAVVRIRACNGDRFLRTDYVSPRTVASRTTAGSRQPLLG